MRLHDAVPDCVKIFLKQSAYCLYLLSEQLFKGPFNKYDFQAITIFRKHLKHDSNCVDIGANVGHILREIIKAAPDGKHIAFEPIPGLFNHLQKKYGSKVKLYNCALSDQEGQAEFHYYRDSPALSGFKERKKLGEYNILKLIVETKTLDNIIPLDRPIDLIKIDVEGAELTVLQGAIETLKRNKPIVLFEFGVGGVDEYDATPEQFFDLFNECGLSLSLMEYFLQGRKPFIKEEFCGQFYKHYNYFYIAYDASKI
ncbi:MAG: FkbM family methyltransferase [Flavisolibacter sp.]